MNSSAASAAQAGTDPKAEILAARAATNKIVGDAPGAIKADVQVLVKASNTMYDALAKVTMTTASSLRPIPQGCRRRTSPRPNSTCRTTSRERAASTSVAAELPLRAQLRLPAQIATRQLGRMLRPVDLHVLWQQWPRSVPVPASR